MAKTESIDYNLLSALSQEINAIGKNLEESISQMKNCVNSLSGSWSGTGYEGYQNNTLKMLTSSSLESYITELYNASKYLDGVVENYKNLESTMVYK